MAAEGSVPTIQSIFEGHLRKKLDVLESIRADLNEEKITVPGIVVCGSQSTGKSSVLESVSGIPLPRGEKITTRVPLILRLEGSELLAPGEVKMYIGRDADVIGKGTEVGYDDISNMIQQLTDQLVGPDNQGGVSNLPIHLKVIRRDSPTLTLIDLPGIAYNSADEAQSATIYAQTSGLVKEWVRKDENSEYLGQAQALQFLSSIRPSFQWVCFCD